MLTEFICFCIQWLLLWLLSSCLHLTPLWLFCQHQDMLMVMALLTQVVCLLGDCWHNCCSAVHVWCQCGSPVDTEARGKEGDTYRWVNFICVHSDCCCHCRCLAVHDSRPCGYLGNTETEPEPEIPLSFSDSSLSCFSMSGTLFGASANIIIFKYQKLHRSIITVTMQYLNHHSTEHILQWNGLSPMASLSLSLSIYIYIWNKQADGWTDRQAGRQMGGQAN